jgi:hypothetical protein
MTELFTFSSPQYIQTKDKKPAYHFSITNKEPLVVSSEKTPDLSSTLASTDGVEFIKSFTELFASQCSKFFPKPLSAERLAPKLTHIIKTIDDAHEGEGVVMWHLLPESICVSGISLQVYWKVIKTTSVIQWEAEEEEIPPEPEPEPEPEVQAEVAVASTNIQQAEGLQEVGTDDIENTTGEGKPEFILGPSAAAKEKDKKKLREAKLQVELARFRAARAYEKYVAKYGDDLSDTDTGGEESEYE